MLDSAADAALGLSAGSAAVSLQLPVDILRADALLALQGTETATEHKGEASAETKERTTSLPSSAGAAVESKSEIKSVCRLCALLASAQAL